jgi:hypothetical protein
MTNIVKYTKTRKYRDVGFSETLTKEEKIRPRRSILIKKKKNIFQRIWDKIKSLKK